MNAMDIEIPDAPAADAPEVKEPATEKEASTKESTGKSVDPNNKEDAVPKDTAKASTDDAPKAKGKDDAEPKAKPEQKDKDKDDTEPKAEKAPEPEKFTVKVNGKEQQLTRDEMIREVQKARAAQEKFQEAAQVRKQAMQMVEFAKANPDQFLGKLGLDFHEIAEQKLLEKYRLEAMSPEEREREMKLREYEQLKRNAEDAERRYQQQQQEQKKQAYQKKFVSDITDALKEAGIEVNQRNLAHVASFLRAQHMEGVRIHPRDVIPHLKAEQQRERDAHLQSLRGMKPAELVQALGQDTIDQFLAWQREQVEAQRIKKREQKTTNPSGGAKREPTQKIYRNWQAMMADI